MKDYQHDYSDTNPLNPESTALVIIDMQYASGCRDTGLGRMLREQGLEETGRYRFDRIEQVVIPGIKRLLKYFRSNKLGVIFVTVGSEQPDYSDVSKNIRKLTQDFHNTKGQIEHNILDELKPETGELVINKTTVSVFNSTNLGEILRDMGKTSLIFTGISTSQCVESSARDAFDLGFRCTLVEDCCAEDDASQHDATILQFGRLFGNIENSETVLTQLNKT